MEAEPADGTVWADADFDAMGWHDITVHAMGFDERKDTARLLLDIDYILR